MIDQFLPSFSAADAIGNHVLRMQRVLKQFGESGIYVARVDGELRRFARPFQWWEARDTSIALYHASIGSPMARFLAGQNVPVIIDYHNVTPMQFFAAYEPRVAALCYAGKSECAQFAERCPLGLADSEFSERELKSMGFPKTATIPILTDFSRYEVPANARLQARLDASKKGADVLFVGRLSPNKRQEDAIKVFAVLKREFDPGARLFLVGRSSSDRYARVLKAFVEHLELDGVYFAGSAPEPDLFAYYRACDVFLSMSEHEGFSVPMIESMIFGLPVAAFAAAAVPETLGSGGAIFDHRRYEEIAALLHLIATDSRERERLAAAGRERLEYFRPEPHEERLAELIGSVVR